MKETHAMMAGWCFSEVDLAEAVAGGLLLNPSIDLGMTCDLNCPYCYTETVVGKRRKHRPAELNKAEMFAVLDDFVMAGARTVNIVGAGEPLLSPLLRSVVEHLHHSEVTVVVFTNGTKLATDNQFARFLFDHGVTVVLKYNSRRSELQDAVAGRRGYSNVRDQALKLLLDTGFNSAQPTRLGVDTLVFAGNLAELPDIHRWCRHNNIYPLTSDFIPTGRTERGLVRGEGKAMSIDPDLAEIASNELLPLTPEQRAVLVCALAEIDAELGIDCGDLRAYYGGGVCTQILGVYVDVEGTIWPCVAQRRLSDPVNEPLGSINRGDKPSEIWRNSQYLESIRKDYTGICPYKAPISRIVPVGDMRKHGTQN